MAPGPVQTFAPFTPEQWVTAQALIKDKTGIVLEGDAGQSSSKGVTLRYAYTSGNQTLEVQLMNRAFYDPSAETIEADIAQAISGIMKA